MAGTGTAHLRPNSLLEVHDLEISFPVAKGGTVHAVSGISLDVAKGEVLGLVGESGCGKSTTSKAIVGHVRPTSGVISLDGVDLATLGGEARRRINARIQMIFQDPISSLNPRHTVEEIIGQGLDIWQIGTKRERAEKVAELMEAVGLRYNPAAKRRRSSFSGGQCQRISIARALALDPEILICDEVVSALDVSVQAQILNLLGEMRERLGLTMLFVTHDLGVVRHVSDRIAVMYLGKLCEVAETEPLFSRPAHPYTRSLLNAVPVRDPQTGLPQLSRQSDDFDGEPPSPINPPSGCRFNTRCPLAQSVCAVEEPVIREIRPGHFVACHFPMMDEVPVVVSAKPAQELS
ncbi:MAG: ABC transporter ATP-binding protein [Microthrixaceae bacterium]